MPDPLCCAGARRSGGHRVLASGPSSMSKFGAASAPRTGWSDERRRLSACACRSGHPPHPAARVPHRVPMFAGTVILTLHVVTASGAATARRGSSPPRHRAVAISGPWRGRLLDHRPAAHGRSVRRRPARLLVHRPVGRLRALVALAALAGLFVVPTFSILRQVILRSVPGRAAPHGAVARLRRHGAVLHGRPGSGGLARDVVAHELGPVGVELASAAAGFVIWLVNPALTSTRRAPLASLRPRRRQHGPTEPARRDAAPLARTAASSPSSLPRSTSPPPRRRSSSPAPMSVSSPPWG